MAEKGTATQTAQEPTALKLVEAAPLLDRISRIHNSIARRAIKLFESEGRVLGRELDHWLKAEAELLHPVHVQIWESGDALEVQAEVPGFNDKELEVSVEPFRIMISGKKDSNEERKKRTTLYREQCSNEVFRVIDLPVEVEATKATATLKNGILTLSAPKVAEAKTPKSK